MKNQHKNIDEQLRELDNQQLPDLSQIDKHWKAFSTLPSWRPYYRRPSLWVASLVVLVVAVWIQLDTQKRPKELSNIVAESVPVDTVPKRPRKSVAPVINDSARKAGDSSAPHKVPKKTLSRKVILHAKTHLGKDTLLIGEVVGDDSRSSTLQLEEFFSTLATPSQKFEVDNRFDTVLVGNSGSLLSISANSFGKNKQVSIVLTEFYTKEEFVRNRLVTMAGDKTLISGGMVKIEALENGKKIEMDSSFKIRWSMPVRNLNLAGMELFEGVAQRSPGPDSSLLSLTDRLITWVPTWKPFLRKDTTKSLKAVDIRNTPYKTKYRKGGEIGYFLLAENSVITAAQLADSLKSRFKYRKVFVKQEYEMVYSLRKNARLRVKRYDTESLGDSTQMDSTQIKFYNLAGKESVRYDMVEGSYYQDSSELSAIYNMPVLMNLAKDRYGVDLNKLGWINCDRFSNDPRPTRPMIVDLGDTAKNYYTVLVFKNLAVALNGFALGSSQSVKFAAIPDGEPVTVVSIGVRNGKISSAMQEFVCGSSGIFTLTGFTESTPDSFKKKLTTLDK